MSDRRCDECTSRYSLRTYAPCSRCDGVPGHPEWLPNEQHALRIRAEQAEARVAELERELAAEREHPVVQCEEKPSGEWGTVPGAGISASSVRTMAQENDRLKTRVAEMEAAMAAEREVSAARLAALEWLRIGCDEPQTRPDFYEIMSAAIDATVGPREGEQ